ncbi:hypothetical protein CJ030_MR2G028836 [Morella rubra]|uniref:GDSL esterase/lipase n=1 Tax=Morella rubra TaxID=262757 RepID=A0A6A1W9C7_9ROSI|nr:hypothetical protein CJ030_MR2G028836 [Morella rubra]
MAKANYEPYGIDFPGGPTGRFTNGRTTVDIIAELLGFETYIPPFATATGLEILKGVNYASGSAGIRNETGIHLGIRFSLDRQLHHHRVTVSRIAKILEFNHGATEHLSKCIYSVGMGSNDYINNYFMPNFYPTSRIYTQEEYATVLIQQYSAQIKTLYSYGARKIALFGLGLIGCTPHAISVHGTNGSACVDEMNNAVALFNGELKSLVDKLNADLPDANLIYVNTFGMGMPLESIPPPFTVLNVGCCKLREDGQCMISQPPCRNRFTYAFYDSFHPTEAANKITAHRSYSAFLPSDTYPIDISHLAQR